MHPQCIPQASFNKNPAVSQAQAAKAKGKAAKRKSHNGEEVVVDSQAQCKKSRDFKKKVVVDLGNEEDDGKGKGKWKDFWVDQLIHVRGWGGGMNEEFNNLVKQGVNLWAKVATQLAATYLDFDKDSEDCRKKFQQCWFNTRSTKSTTLFLTMIGGTHVDWYDVEDEYCHDRATSIPLSHASLITQDDSVKPSEGESIKEYKRPPLFIASKSHTTLKNEKSIAQMTDIKKDLLEYLKDSSNHHDILEREHLILMAGMHECMIGYLKYVESRDD
ncbi:hypothetical protein L7F22_035111 [Adiantum nelumboides]|nr:hypothetical protein [Adiantum nelumboides]